MGSKEKNTVPFNGTPEQEKALREMIGNHKGQLGAHFDFMARHGELKHDHVLLEIRRFNDLYKLVFDEIK